MHDFTHVFFLHTLMYKQKFASIHFFISPTLVAAGWDSFSSVECAVLLWWRAPSVDHHGHILSMTRCHIIFDGDFN
jgi:hypothetical protein